MKPGDIYAVQLPDKRYGAVRILKIFDKSCWLYVTTYINDSLPILNDKHLTEILIQNRFYFKNEPAITCVNGKPPKKLIYIGNIELSEQEIAIHCNRYSGKFDESVADNVYMEWRWMNDKENYIKEREDEKKAEKQNSQKEKVYRNIEMMDEDVFWSIIDCLDWSNEGNDDKVIEPVIKKLAKLSVKEIKKFAETLSYKLYLLDTKEHAKNIGVDSYTEQNQYISSDWFLYVRCVAIVNGKDFYYKALNTPINMPKDIEFESLLEIPHKAYEIKTKNYFDYETEYSYETFSNKKGWL